MSIGSMLSYVMIIISKDLDLDEILVLDLVRHPKTKSWGKFSCYNFMDFYVIKFLFLPEKLTYWKPSLIAGTINRKYL